MAGKYKYVAVVGIDGMGCFNKLTPTPRMDEIFQNGAVTYSALSMDPTISAENWGGMLLGAKPVVHGLTNSIVGSREYHNDALPSLFKRIRESFPQAYLASCCNWNPINHGIIEHDIGVDLVTAGNDDMLISEIESRISKKPVFLFVQFDDVDGAGHTFGYSEKGHLDKITETDALVGRIYDAYRNEGILDDTLFIVIADHGGILKGHGGYSDGEKYIFLAAAGAGVSKGDIGDAQTRDIAAIVLYALGLEVPQCDEDGFSSEIPDGIFPEVHGKYTRPVPVPNEIKTSPTPDFVSNSGLASFFGRERIKLAMYMDNSVIDASASCLVEEHGTVKYYSTGVYGSRGEFGATGCATAPDVVFGKKSFTLAVWLRIDRAAEDEPAICGNKDWWCENRNQKGVVLAARSNNTLFNISDGNGTLEFSTPFPDDVSEGWVHIIYAVDRESREARVWNNFKYIRTVALPDNITDEVDSLPFTVGNDGCRRYNNDIHEHLVNIDDMLVFSGAFDSVDADKLKRYYNL